MFQEQDKTRELGERDICPFCTPQMIGFTHFEERGLPRIDLSVVRKSKSFRVQPDSLPVHPNGSHMLIIPNDHLYGFAFVPTEHGEEVQTLIDGLESTLEEELVLFEHGGIKHGGGLQSVYHAHAHLIGSEGHDVLSYMGQVMSGDGIDYELISANHNPIRNIQNTFRGEGYFYVQQNGNALMAHDPEDVLPSQIAQRNMSLLLTGEVVNWKEMPQNPQYADLSIGRISTLLERVGYEMPIL